MKSVMEGLRNAPGGAGCSGSAVRCGRPRLRRDPDGLMTPTAAPVRYVSVERGKRSLVSHCSTAREAILERTVVVRISRGSFAAEKLREVSDTLNEWQPRLEPALRALDGLTHYYVAVDGATNSMTNVSVWETLENAKQMDTLAVMLEQREAFVDLGVDFDPIRNHTTLWAISP